MLKKKKKKKALPPRQSLEAKRKQKSSTDDHTTVSFVFVSYKACSIGMRAIEGARSAGKKGE